MTEETELLDRITVRDDIFGGKPVICDMRIAVEPVLEMMAAGGTAESILDEHPILEPEGIQAVSSSLTAPWTKRNYMIAFSYEKLLEISLDVCAASRALLRPTGRSRRPGVPEQALFSRARTHWTASNAFGVQRQA